MTKPEESAHEELVRRLSRNRVLAHEFLFRERHSTASPPHARTFIEAFHSLHRFVLFMAFRGSAKSTIMEEGMAIQAAEKRFQYGLVLSANEKLACQHLAAVKAMVDNSANLRAIYNISRGGIWQTASITLSNGVVIAAMGHGQSMRGTKEDTIRPDFVLVDDIEDEDEVSSPEARQQFRAWWYKSFEPALEPGCRIRMGATPLDPEALAVGFSKETYVRTITVPVKHVDGATNEWVSAWPERFPMARVDDLERKYAAAGMAEAFAQEYMCDAVAPGARLFLPEHIRVKPVKRAFHQVYAAYDPARTTNKATSSQTGKVVFSWRGNRLIIWEAEGFFWKPDELIDDIAKTAAEYDPVLIGVEQTGLHDFVNQPLAQRAAADGVYIPIKPLDAPRGKLGFIQELQPLFAGNLVTFAQACPTLEAQLLNFPRGRLDVINALAYALWLRPGMPVYQAFNEEHMQPGLTVLSREPVYMTLNATPTLTAASLCQLSRGRLRVVADFVYEGTPAQYVPHLLKEAKLLAGVKPVVVAPPSMFLPSDITGLKASVLAAGQRIREGSALDKGREALTAMMGRMAGDKEAVAVSTRAAWTVKALAGGYGFARPKRSTVLLAREPEQNAYRVLMEGLESFAGLASGLSRDNEGQRNYDVTAGGARYLTARPAKG